LKTANNCPAKKVLRTKTENRVENRCQENRCQLTPVFRPLVGDGLLTFDLRPIGPLLPIGMLMKAK
jgi:hypothetical protein